MSAATPAPVWWCVEHDDARCQYADLDDQHCYSVHDHWYIGCVIESRLLVDPFALVVERPDGFTDAEWESANGYFTDLFSQFLAGGARREAST